MISEYGSMTRFCSLFNENIEGKNMINDVCDVCFGGKKWKLDYAKCVYKFGKIK